MGNAPQEDKPSNRNSIQPSKELTIFKIEPRSEGKYDDSSNIYDATPEPFSRAGPATSNHGENTPNFLTGHFLGLEVLGKE